MFQRDNDHKEDSRGSIFSVLEFLDPLACKITAKQFPLLYNRHDKEVNSRSIADYDKQAHVHSSDHGRTSKRDRIYKHYHNKAKLPIDELRQKIFNRIRKLDEPLDLIFIKNPSPFEKLFYPFALLNILGIGYIMGKLPEWFHVYYTVILAILMPIRFYTYYKTQSHYYLADLCYFVNLMCLVFIWICPYSINLFQSCFAFTFGSLAFAIITWRNSLVLHSIDKTTSCFIHIMPPCTMYVVYHGLPETYKMERFPGAQKSISLKTNIIWTSFYYLVWQSLYHYFITMRKSSKIKSGQRVTSFEYLTKHQFKDFWAVKLPYPWPMIMYTLLQYLYQLCTMLLCGIWLRYKQAALLFLLFLFLTAAHNGATYYIDHYSKTFQNEVTKLREEVDILQQQLKEKNNNSTSESLSSSTTELNRPDNSSFDDVRSALSLNSQCSSIIYSEEEEK